MLSRCNLSSDSQMLYKAPFRLKIWLWTATFVGRHSKSDQVYVATAQKDCTPALGTPLPDPAGGIMPIPITLEVGEELWAVSESVSLVGLSVERA